ncbi:hypothetical protein ACET3X_009056 [Alternaria dauci]|uniref:Uncharacterized protein n=1 Tax=Alternaria dauci TaxID=48095 RepID=A0ABR3U8E5_9PLEO
MYTSVSASLILIVTALAAELPLGPSHSPAFPSELDPKSARLSRKRDFSISNAAHGRDTLNQEDPSASAPAFDVLSSSFVFLPATSELSSATTLVTVTSTTSTFTSAAPTSTLPAVPDDTWAGVYVCNDINWNGACSHKFTKPSGASIDCAQLSGQESSLGPDPGFLCEFFT